MAEYPALPLFTDAFISDTTHLTAAQTGAYFMLLIIAWRTKENALPDDDQKLALWSRLGMKSWLAQKSVIMSFWKLKEDGLWHQSRLDDERRRAEVIRERNSLAGTASALKRQGRHSTNVGDLFNQTSTPSPSPSPSPKKSKEKPPIPPLFDKFWEAFPKRRRDSKNQSLPAYLKAITRASEEEIYEGTLRYAASDEVERGYAKGTIAWLNGDRWNHDYRAPQAAVNGKRTYGDSLQNAAQTANLVLNEKENLREKEPY